ncbi:Uncharacterised protein [Streptococcus acidominimus]|uniref:Uncharacterized protein n=1 Tax=Streptococcus acidominimus TaxID=1326 RepID=A0A239XCK2_STRAI|nr:Uncharacterised protein [Streptococcus acidominimus]
MEKVIVSLGLLSFVFLGVISYKNIPVVLVNLKMSQIISKYNLFNSQLQPCHFSG